MPAFDPARVADVLDAWLATRLAPDAATWLRERCAATASGDKKSLFLAFGLAVRKTGKADLQLNPQELAVAADVRPGWKPRHWTTDQAARVRLVLSYPSGAESAGYVSVLDQLFAAGEMHELVALYQGLPLYPHQPAHQLRCAEGIRSNIRAVFCAVAHHNPYPSEQLNDDQWNQLILKCQFVGVSLEPVVGFDQRANSALARMLVDYAHERWAAKRPVNPELWRAVGPFADDRTLADLQRVLTTGSPVERQAAALALTTCRDANAAVILREAPDLAAAAQSGGITWAHVAAAAQ